MRIDRKLPISRHNIFQKMSFAGKQTCRNTWPKPKSSNFGGPNKADPPMWRWRCSSAGPARRTGCTHGKGRFAVCASSAVPLATARLCRNGRVEARLRMLPLRPGRTKGKPIQGGLALLVVEDPDARVNHLELVVLERG